MMDVRALFAGLFVLLFAVLISGYIVLGSVAATATDAGFYRSAFENAGIYDRLYNAGLAKMAGGLLSEADVASVKQDFPVSEFKTVVDDTILQMIAYLTGRREAIPVLSMPAMLGSPARDVSVSEFMDESSLQQMRSVAIQFFALLGIILAGAVAMLLIALALGHGIAGRIALAGKALIIAGALDFVSCVAILAVPLMLLGAMRMALPQRTLAIAEPLVGEFLSRVFWLALASALALLLVGAALLLFSRRMKKRQA